MTLWIPAIGIALYALAACDVAPQKPKTLHSVVSTGAHPALLLRNESREFARDDGDTETDPRSAGQTTGTDSVRLHGPGVKRHLQIRT
jgi:hypothetical protein